MVELFEELMPLPIEEPLLDDTLFLMVPDGPHEPI